MTDAQSVLSALADPVRVEILDRVAAGSEITVTQLADVLPMTRQGVTRHVRTLVDAGLLVGERGGREHRYRVAPGSVTTAQRWLAQRAAAWDEALDRLARHLDSS